MANNALTELATAVSQGGDIDLELENIPEDIQLPPNIDLSQPIDVESDVPIPQEVLEQLPSDVDVQVTGQVEGQTPQRRSVEEQLVSINDIVARRGQEQEPPSEQSEGGFFSDALDVVGDVAKGISAAPYNLVDGIMDTSEGISNLATDTFQALTSDEHSFEDVSWRPRSEKSLRFNAYQPSGVAGKMADEMTQFAITFGVVGTAFKTANVLTKASVVGRGAAQGAVADLILIDTQEERLSNLIEQYPMLSNPVTRYLQMDEGDAWFENKMKGVLEGVIVGGALDSFIWGVKAYKRSVRAAEGKPMVEPKAVSKTEDISPSISGPADDVLVDKTLLKNDLKNGDAKLVPVSDGNSRGPSIDRAKMLRMVRKASQQTEDFSEILDNINLKRITTKTPQGSHLLREIAEAHADNTLKSAGKEGFEKVQKDVAKELTDYGYSVDELLDQAKHDNASLKDITRRMLIRRNFLSVLSDEVINLADKIAKNQASTIETKRFLEASDILRDMQIFEANTRTEIGRGLSSRRIQADGQIMRDTYGEGEDFFKRMFNGDETNTNAQEWLSKRGASRKHLKQAVNDVQMLRNNKAGVTRYMKNNIAPSTLWGMAKELRINNILSGTYTHAINISSTALKTVTLPLERAIGGTIDGALNRDIQTIKRSWRQSGTMYWGMSKYFTDSLCFAGKAFKADTNQLDTFAREEITSSSHFSYERMKARLTKGVEGAELNTLQEITARSMSYLGKAINLPSRCLMTEDEFFKQLNFRSDLYTHYYDEAVDNLNLTKSKDIAEYVEQKMNEAFSPTGAVVRGELTEASLERARQATWTQALDPHSSGANLQRWANDRWYMHIAVPFIRTPSNIIDDFIDHSFLAPRTKRWKDAIRKGGEARADMYGKIALGSVACYTAFELARAHLITGSPPSDPQRRKQLEASGWQAYSIKIGDTYVSYNRMDPIAMFFSLVADANVCIEESEINSNQDMWDLTCIILASVVENIGSKSYLSGLTDAMDMINRPRQHFQSKAENIALSFIPYSSFFRMSRKQVDPYYREASTFLEKFYNSTPFFSKTLPTKRNWVTGEIDGYNTLSQTLDDPHATFADFLPDSRREKRNGVLLELAQLGQHATSTPPKQIQGFGQSVDMTSEQYSRFCELHATVKLNGKTMMEQLAILMTHPNYNVQRQLNGTKGDTISDEVRGEYVNKIIRQYRKAAKVQLKREFPEINQELRDKAIKERTPTNGSDQQKSRYANYY